jgi:hypothetical protein
MYRDTLDDPAFNVQKLDDFARSYEQKLNELGYEIVERADPTVNPKLQELYDEYPESVSGQQRSNNGSRCPRVNPTFNSKSFKTQDIHTTILDSAPFVQQKHRHIYHSKEP